MTTRRDVSSWLPGLIGPTDFKADGQAVDVPKRGKLNFVGATITDDPENGTTNIEIEGALEATAEIGASVAFNEDGTPSDKRKKVASVGMFDPHDYKAKGDGLTNDHQKIVDTLRAINESTTINEQRGATVQLAEKKTYLLNERLEIDASHTIRGASSASGPLREPLEQAEVCRG
jgi:hypothetical protein